MLRASRDSHSAWSRDSMNGEAAGRGKRAGGREVAGNDLVADLQRQVEFARWRRRRAMQHVRGHGGGRERLHIPETANGP